MIQKHFRPTFVLFKFQKRISLFNQSKTKAMKNNAKNQSKQTAPVLVLDQAELVTLNGGVTDNGDGGGCIPNPFPMPKLPFPYDKEY